MEKSGLAETQKKIEQIKARIQKLRSERLSTLLNQIEDVSTIFNEQIRANRLLVFLLRRGYIDEDYANYMNYFKGTSLTKDDMNFILSIKDRIPKEWTYPLTKIDIIVRRLQAYEFQEKVAYNFNLLTYLLINDQDYQEQLENLFKSLADETETSWNFIESYLALEKQNGKFFVYIANSWANLFNFITSRSDLSYDKQVWYLEQILHYVALNRIVEMNTDNAILEFLLSNKDILQRLREAPKDKIIGLLDALKPQFYDTLFQASNLDVVEHIIKHNLYSLNYTMIYNLVAFYDPAETEKLDQHIYTTLLKLDVSEIFNYIEENIKLFIDNVFMEAENTNEKPEAVLKILQRVIEDDERIEKVIVHEKCKFDFASSLAYFKEITSERLSYIWDLFLDNDRVMADWENIAEFAHRFGYRESLVNFITRNCDALVNKDATALDSILRNNFIKANIPIETFEQLLPILPIESYELESGKISDEKLEVMIQQHYFDFNSEYYNIVWNQDISLCAKYVLENQDKTVQMLSDLKMNQEMFEKLLTAPDISLDLGQQLLDKYETRYINQSVAGQLLKSQYSIQLGVFEKVFGLLAPDKQKEWFLKEIEIMDANSIQGYFQRLGNVYEEYKNLSNREKLHKVLLTDSPENILLVANLQKIGYISSWKKESNKNNEVFIACMVRKA